MTQYHYPRNLKATANMWLWSLRDFAIIGIAALLSIVAVIHLRTMLFAAATLTYGFLTIRMDDTTLLDDIVSKHVIANKYVVLCRVNLSECTLE